MAHLPSRPVVMMAVFSVSFEMSRGMFWIEVMASSVWIFGKHLGVTSTAKLGVAWAMLYSAISPLREPRMMHFSVSRKQELVIMNLNGRVREHSRTAGKPTSFSFDWPLA